MNQETCQAPLNDREKDLIAKGWEKQLAYDEPRLSEVVELYRSMGREVKVEPTARSDQPLGKTCDSCFTECDETMHIVWTRSRKVAT